MSSEDSKKPGDPARTLRGDIAGGLSAAIIALPLALGFGVISFAPLGDPAAGALAGLYGAIFTGFFAAVFGGTPSQVTGPTGPMTVVTTALVAEVMKYDAIHGHADDAVHVTVLVFMTGMLGGVFQILLGVLRAGSLIKFIPYPVIAGFMNGIAVIIFLGQVKPFLGIPSGSELLSLDIRWAVLGTAVVTVAVILGASKLAPKLPAGLVGLAVGTGAYFLFGNIGDPELLVFEGNRFIVGEIPRAIPTPHYVLDVFKVILGLDMDILRIIVPPALALAVLGAIDSLLTSLVADVATRTRHDSNRELIGQGIGNFVSGAFGGLSGAGATVRTLVNVENGGRGRLSGAVHGLALLLVLLLLGPAAGWIPLSVLAGILVVTSVNMVDSWSLQLLRKPSARRDVIVIAIVTVVTVTVDLMVAVGIGLLVSVFLFMKELAKAGVVRIKYHCAHQRSKRVRSDDEEKTLVEHGNEILVYELEGSLFFGRTDAFATDVEDELKIANPPICTLILDLRRVSRIDITGAELIKRIVDQVKDIACGVRLSGLTGTPNQKEMVAYLEELEVLSTVGDTHVHQNLDVALETAEDVLLGRHLAERTVPSGPHGAVRRSVLFRELDDGQWAHVEGLLTEESYEGGATVLARGDPGDRLCILESGHISVQVNLDDDEQASYRMASFGPGRHFGDLTFLDGSPRSGTVIADEPTVLAILKRDQYTKLEAEHPAIAFKILHGLAHRLSERLRVTSEELIERQSADA